MRRHSVKLPHMIEFIKYKDEIVAITAAVGAILGVVNLVKSVSDNKVRIDVTCEADYGDTFIITVVNKSKFDVTVADVGMVNDSGSLDSISIMSEMIRDTHLPARIQSHGYYPFEAPIRLEFAYRLGCFKAFARTATGKMIYGPDPRPWYKRMAMKVKVRYGHLVCGNSFRKI